VSLTVASAGGAHKAASPSDPASYVVDIRGFAFSPRTLVISVGSKVTWENEDDEPHKVAETNHAFTSPPLDTGEGFAYEFKTAGKYEYFCTIHPHMTGEIVVESK
jgi:plastocyanin